MHVQLSLSLHLYLAFNQMRWKWPVTTCCPRYRRLVALKRAGCVVCWLWRETVSVRTCSKWCHFAFMFSRNRFLHWPTALSMTFCYILAHVNEAALQVAGHRGWYRRQVFVQCTHVPASVHKFCKSTGLFGRHRSGEIKSGVSCQSSWTVSRAPSDVRMRQFHCSYLKANKVSKSEGTRKVEHAHHF